MWQTSFFVSKVYDQRRQTCRKNTSAVQTIWLHYMSSMVKFQPTACVADTTDTRCGKRFRSEYIFAILLNLKFHLLATECRVRWIRVVSKFFLRSWPIQVAVCAFNKRIKRYIISSLALNLDPRICGYFFAAWFHASSGYTQITKRKEESLRKGLGSFSSFSWEVVEVFQSYRLQQSAFGSSCPMQTVIKSWKGISNLRRLLPV